MLAVPESPGLPEFDAPVLSALLQLTISKEVINKNEIIDATFLNI